jgi:hypothetical protein
MLCQGCCFGLILVVFPVICCAYFYNRVCATVDGFTEWDKVDCRVRNATRVPCDGCKSLCIAVDVSYDGMESKKPVPLELSEPCFGERCVRACCVSALSICSSGTNSDLLLVTYFVVPRILSESALPEFRLTLAQF